MVEDHQGLRRQGGLGGRWSELLREVSGYSRPGDESPEPNNLEPAVLMPLKIRTSLGLLSFFTTTTVFGTPVDVTLSELAIEMFFPADAATAEAVRKAAA